MARDKSAAEALTIGQVARRAGVNVETIRYYERQRLLLQPKKPERGFRRYRPDTIARIRFIKRAQELGFTLKEAGRLLMLAQGRTCGTTRALAAQKLALVETRLADLNRLRRVLRDLIMACDTTAAHDRVSCPILSALSRGDS